MKAEYINPFLESARIVIEQVANVRPTTGKLSVKDIYFIERYVWIQIGMTGQMQGNIRFGFEESTALRMVSAMMGGFILTELDEMGHSAISELGNMISGNASTILYNQGIKVDITPPKVVTGDIHEVDALKALTVPLLMDGIGELDIQVLLA
ncbi:chemotaxis protein CheX [Paenibacillus chitinolyticus]|uniref:Chemotaxis protein CheX n=1 Tax=Paenibacillus chitinolyticus TaxID=79263 RepID=A0A410X2I5_9BACL|nr:MULTISPECIES: chemotaxis protein CheX [Paenibacillus]MCY9591428.1 chemotaxis protein CheX [Paenibacillus chitinolyticus]MCY9599417.1 chemotaxis protein CheX [Paenibacillus chitinolyticus]QAV20830.1 chemotaxis protein CheX [Paenibacillus chitinolyticus]SEG37532.1 chemotaxis protein CheX [Paenibacillus sp. UNC499MF]GKS14581.1 CheY-P phosphatase CheX [Paenibacillus chitinolyticus]